MVEKAFRHRLKSERMNELVVSLETEEEWRYHHVDTLLIPGADNVLSIAEC
jgi:hypothetical protein